MPAVLETPAPAPPAKAVRGHIRGSSLLLAGRFLSKGLNFVVQILIVRYLSQSDYGALAYALSMVALVQAISTFGLDRAVTRFVPMYHEREEYGKLFGTIIMVLLTIFTIGLTASLLFVGIERTVAPSLMPDRLAQSLFLILIFLAPVQAIDEVLVGLFAVFAHPRAIFFRKNVLAPLLKLAVVLVLIWSGGNVFLVAGGYLIAGLIGTLICTILLVRVLRRQHLFRHLDFRNLKMPWGEVLVFTIPLLTSELVHVVMHTMDVIVLGWYGDTRDVASLRAVQPMALMNHIVMAAFATLFTPVVARMLARGEHRQMNELYWQTAVWISILTFPIFVLTFSFADSVAVAAYGPRYASSGPILALLSLGCYINAALGFNGLTLKVCGRLKYIVVMNIAATLINLALILVLIPRYGALGAALGTCITVIIHTILKQYGMRVGTGVELFAWRYIRVYVSIMLISVGLWMLQHWLHPPLAISLGLAVVASLVVLIVNWKSLQAAHNFPELQRLKLVRWLVG